MFNKKLFYSMILMFCLISISMVSAGTIVVDTTSDGYLISPSVPNYISVAGQHDFIIHVFNLTTGLPITDGLSCFLFIYNNTGQSIVELLETTAGDNLEYDFDVEGGNFTIGHYVSKFQCNNTDFGGSATTDFYVNIYGLDLTDAQRGLFGVGMAMLMVFLFASIIGIFKVDHYIGKFALYWVSHLLAIVITFSAWQFTWGYALGYGGVALAFKVLFYFVIYSVIPMMMLSIAWIIYIHTFNEHFQKLIDKGETPETAFKMTNKRKKNWFSGGGR